MIRINLLKGEKKEVKEITPTPLPEKRKERKQIPLPVFVGVVFVVICGFLFIQQRNTLKKEIDLLEQAKQEKKSLKDVMNVINEFEQQKSLFQRKINLINELKSKQRSAVIIMDEISRRLPDWVWLTETELKDQTIRIKGKALTNNLIADFIYNLEESAYFSSVNFNRSTQKQQNQISYFEFSLTTQFSIPENIPPSPAASVEAVTDD